MPRPLALLALLALFLAGADSGRAQRVTGRILESGSDRPLTGALVMAEHEGGELVSMAMSGPDGGFDLGLPADVSVRLIIERLGYASTESVPLSLPESDSLRLEIRLRAVPFELAGITATAARRLNRNVEGFLRRREYSQGRFIGPEGVARVKPNSAMDLVVPMSSRLFQFGQYLKAVKPISSVRQAERVQSGAIPECNPRVFLDGQFLNPLGWAPPDSLDVGSHHPRPRPVALDSYVDAEAIRAVEFYDNPNKAPSQFQQAFMEDCPVVVIWTDWAFGLSQLRGKEWWRQGRW